MKNEEDEKKEEPKVKGGLVAATQFKKKMAKEVKEIVEDS